MKALLWKEFCLLRRQLKFYLIALLIMAIVPNRFMQLFAGAYTAFIPYNTLALDEQCRWDELAAMMPYSTRTLVLSKYVCGWICCGCYTLVALLATWLERPFFPDSTAPALVLLAACFGALFVALSLPFLFRFGVSKGRLTMILFIVLCCCGVGTLSSLTENGAAVQLLSGVPIWVIPIVAVLANAVSVPLSERMLVRRRRRS